MNAGSLYLVRNLPEQRQSRVFLIRLAGGRYDNLDLGARRVVGAVPADVELSVARAVRPAA